MKLELKHIVPYLPYGVRCEILNYKCDYVGMQFSALNGYYTLAGSPHFTYDGGSVGKSFSDFKPILRPLSDLTREITIEPEKFVPIEWFEIGDDGNPSLTYDHGNLKLIRELENVAKYELDISIPYLPYGVVERLLQWHFDIFGLIQAGLAIDINTLP